MNEQYTFFHKNANGHDKTIEFTLVVVTRYQKVSNIFQPLLKHREVLINRKNPWGPVRDYLPERIRDNQLRHNNLKRISLLSTFLNL